MYTLERPAQTNERQYTQEEIDAFLKDLTELSHRHGLGIAGKPVLFIMEKDDYTRTYRHMPGDEFEFA
jgi:hypothetical protein